MTGRPLVYEDFADKIGQDFALREDGSADMALRLSEAALLKVPGLPGVRPPFTLVFVADDARVLPQKIYRIEHGALGALDIFLVPVGKDKSGVSYEAVFN